MKRILFADNDTKLLNTRSEFLRAAGYEVLQAESQEEAEQLLAEHNVHLIIVDIRLVRERDERDISGLQLARDERYRMVPKIVLTKYPTYEAVREALGVDVAGLAPPAVNFIAKQEGIGVMLEAIAQVFARHVRVNWNLQIEFADRNPLSFPHLATLLVPKAGQHHREDRAVELENLFRRLFYDHDHLRIERLLWQRDRRVAVVVWALTEGKKPEARVVVVSDYVRTREEKTRYDQFAPAAPGHNSTVWKAADETLHFGANIYALADADLHKLTSLTDSYRALPEKTFHAALQNLCEQTLAKWRRGESMIKADRTDEDCYRELTELTLERVPCEIFDSRIHHLLAHCPQLGIEAQRAAGQLKLRLGKRFFTYPDPLPKLYQVRDAPPAVLNHAPGVLSEDNVLVDAGGHTWLTDFAAAGLASAPWNYAALEAIIRFDWVDADLIAERHEMERCLVSENFSSLDISDVAGALRKPLRAIQVIRRLAARELANPLAYHRALFFLAAGRLLNSYRAVGTPTQSELTRAAHLLLATAMICDLLEQSEHGVAAAGAVPPGLYIDEAKRVVWRDGARVSLRGQSYDLLWGLYENAERLCTHKEIAESFLGERHFDGDESQINRLNAAIHRLRQKIEYEPNRPKFLLTAAGGYRLVRQPGG